MKILALEFSSAQRSVAIVQSAPQGEPQLKSEVIETGPCATNAIGMIQSVLAQAKLELEQIECLAVGLGPGSYNGIRTAIAVAQGWQLGRDVLLQGLSSAECIAAQAHYEGLTGRVATVIDAQRGEFYLANYELTFEGWRELQPLRLAGAAEVRACEQAGELLFGPDVSLRFSAGRSAFPRAGTVGKLALTRSGFVVGDRLEPIYLRKTAFLKAPPARVFPD